MQDPKTNDEVRFNVVAAAIWDGIDSVLIGKRAPSDSFPGVWEFVGGKQELGESLEEALHREIREELGIEIEVLQKLGELDFKGLTHKFRLHVFFARWIKGLPEAFEHQLIEWTKSFDESDRNWSEPDRPFLGPISTLIKMNIS